MKTLKQLHEAKLYEFVDTCLGEWDGDKIIRITKELDVIEKELARQQRSDKNYASRKRRDIDNKNRGQRKDEPRLVQKFSKRIRLVRSTIGTCKGEGP